jgi:N-acetyl-gamma-glutamyl-phosphate reductase
VYGLPELLNSRIQQAQSIANPASPRPFSWRCCRWRRPVSSPMTSRLGHHRLDWRGPSLAETVHFSWRTNSVSIYKPFAPAPRRNRREPGAAAAAVSSRDSLHPLPRQFRAGIFASVYTPSDLTQDEAELYKQFYCRCAVHHGFGWAKSSPEAGSEYQ